jgi:hypothetical protein
LIKWVYKISTSIANNKAIGLDIGSYKFVANQILAQSGGESGNYINIFDGKNGRGKIYFKL